MRVVPPSERRPDRTRGPLLALGIGAALGPLVAWLLGWGEPEAGPRIAPRPHEAAVGGLPHAAAPPSSDAPDPRSAPAEVETAPGRPVAPTELDLRRLIGELDAVLPGHGESTRRRLAELLYEFAHARELDEPEAIRRDITSRVARQFQEIAGESLGTVAARLEREFGASR